MHKPVDAAALPPPQQVQLALISCRCRRRRPRRKASVPKGWMPTNRHRDTSWTLRGGSNRAKAEGSCV